MHRSFRPQQYPLTQAFHDSPHHAGLPTAVRTFLHAISSLPVHFLRCRADPGDDSDPCGSDDCPSTPQSPRPRPSGSQGASTSSTQTQSLNSSPTPQPSGATSQNGGSGGDHSDNGGHADSPKQTKSGFNKSAIGGIVIGIREWSLDKALLVTDASITVALFLILVALFLWLRRRRQQQTAAMRSAGTDGSTGDMRLLADSPFASVPSTSQAPSGAIAAPVFATQGHNQSMTYSNIGNSNVQHDRSASDTTLPNPYDGIYTSPQPSDRPLPPTPQHANPVTELQTLLTSNDPPIGTAAAVSNSSEVSQAPSAWRTSGVSHTMYYDSPDSRVSSMASASSGGAPSEEAALLGEMASYQKRLESHHRKESEDAAVAAATSEIPSDPPPIYSPTEDRHEHAAIEADHSGQELKAV